MSKSPTYHKREKYQNLRKAIKKGAPKEEILNLLDIYYAQIESDFSRHMQLIGSLNKPIVDRDKHYIEVQPTKTSTNYSLLTYVPHTGRITLKIHQKASPRVHDELKQLANILSETVDKNIPVSIRGKVTFKDGEYVCCMSSSSGLWKQTFRLKSI